MRQRKLCSLIHHISLGDHVDDAVLLCGFRIHGTSLQDHRQRYREGGHARKPLSALCTRQQAQVHLRKANGCLRRRNTIVAGQAHLAATTQGWTVESCYHSLGRGIDRVHHLAQGRHGVVLPHLGLTHCHHHGKLGDLSSTREHRAAAGNHYSLYLWILDQFRELLLERGHQARAKRVHRRAAHSQHADSIWTDGNGGRHEEC
mmetsp:Transcript_104003/g.144773  ORF Transcript_104003/g.144773 Transcript_104003/m.144773 type:complete len:203 (+) Transcript_104003:778-1386(+)